MKKLLTLAMILLLILSTVSIPSLKVKAGWTGSTITIKADGSIEPSDAPIVRVGDTYYLTGDVINIFITDGIVVERNNIILEGNDHIVTGSGFGEGVRLENRVNVTIRNIKVENFNIGLFLYYSSNNTPWILDYGSKGWDDTDGQEYWLTMRLRSVVEKIIELDAYGDYYIRFVVVLGDIADSAEISEFKKAREILNSLNDFGIPYVPVIGNHDLLPYTQKNSPQDPLEIRIADEEAPSASGKYFNDVFWNTVENSRNINLITRLFKDWSKSECCLQNYASTYEGFHFIFLDFNTREKVPIFAGVGSDAEPFPETLNWLNSWVPANTGRDLGPPIIIFSHHPMWINYFEAFSKSEIDNILETLAWKGNHSFLNFAGHIHDDKRSSDLRTFAFYSVQKPVVVNINLTVITTEALYQTTKDTIKVVIIDAKNKEIKDIKDYSIPEETPPPYYEESTGSTVPFILSPGELRVYDDQGRVTGWFNGTLRNEIPNAIVNESMKLIILPNNQSKYTYEVKGTDTGNYTLVIANFTRIGDSIATFTASNFSIMKNAIHQYMVDWAPLHQGQEGVVIKLDNDGDGEYEQAMNAGIRICKGRRNLKLKPGYNLISLPIHNVSFTASRLLEMIGDSAQSIFMFNSSSQRYVSYDINLARFGINQTDFEIVPDTGYFIYVTNGTEVSFQGFLKYGLKYFTITPGYNLLGWTSSQEANASRLITLGNGNIRSIF